MPYIGLIEKSVTLASTRGRVLKDGRGQYTTDQPGQVTLASTRGRVLKVNHLAVPNNTIHVTLASTRGRVLKASTLPAVWWPRSCHTGIDPW